MSIEQRRFIRFSLDIPAVQQNRSGDRFQTLLHQISVGGCLMAPDDNLLTGDEFRLEIGLPNGNRLPFHCRALYKFPDRKIGVKFMEITEFEQQLLADIISESLEKEGLPLQVDPFAHPPTFIQKELDKLHHELSENERKINQRLSDEAAFEELLSLDN